MERLRDWEDWQRRIGAVPRAVATYTSNLYAAREQIEDWCAGGRLHALSAEQAVILLRADHGFHRLYHVARDLPALESALGRLPIGTYTTDIVGHGDTLDPVCAVYAARGFVPHTLLQRMTRVGLPSEMPEGDAAIASPEDAADVAALLARLLDPVAEPVPRIDELRREARDGRLLILRRGDLIAGMLLYELKGRTAHLRLWHVDDNARGLGVGRRLMRSFLARCTQAQRLVLWVIGDNERSVAIYRHYGFEPDGLVDRIMIRHEEPRR